MTGAIGATALDMGLPWQLTNASALIGRTLGAIAHSGEEIQTGKGDKSNYRNLRVCWNGLA